VDVPGNRSEFSTAIYTHPPEFASRTRVTAYNTLTGAPVRVNISEYVSKPAFAEVVPVELKYEYEAVLIKPSASKIKTQLGYDIISPEPTVSGGTWNEVPVTIEDEGSSVITITGDTGVILGTRVSRWMGNIYEIVTGYEL